MIEHKIRYRIATFLSVLALLTTGCSDDTTVNTARKDRLVTDQLVPGSTFYTSTTKELTIQGKGFAQGDALALADIATGAEIPLTLKEVDHAYVTFVVPQDIPTAPTASSCTAAGRVKCWASSNSAAASTSRFPTKRA